MFLSLCIVVVADSTLACAYANPAATATATATNGKKLRECMVVPPVGVELRLWCRQCIIDRPLIGIDRTGNIKLERDSMIPVTDGVLALPVPGLEFPASRQLTYVRTAVHRVAVDQTDDRPFAGTRRIADVRHNLIETVQFV